MTWFPIPVRDEDRRYEGVGRIESPVTRKGQLCCYETCVETATHTRVTPSGFAVIYCPRHSALAEAVFGS